MDINVRINGNDLPDGAFLKIAQRFALVEKVLKKDYPDVVVNIEVAMG